MKKIFIGLFLISFILLSGQELLDNPGFEDWTDNGPTGPPNNWNLYGSGITAEQETTTVYDGTYSTKIHWTNSGSVYLRQQDIPVTPTYTYNFSFRVFDNDMYGRARVCLRWFDSGGDFIAGTYGEYSTDSEEWQYLETGFITCPLGTATVDVEIRVYDSEWGVVNEATVYVDNASFVPPGDPVIIGAYCPSLTELDLLYSADLTSVNPADYELWGTANINFSTAEIDPLDSKLVHLSEASVNMNSDTVRDTISDQSRNWYEFYAGLTPVSLTNTTNPSGTISNGLMATFSGIVYAIASNKVWIHDAQGPYNGVLIYDYDLDEEVTIGDLIEFYAERTEYYGLTELEEAELISAITTGTVFDPVLITGADIAETNPVNEDPAEKYEGQLVRLEDVLIDSNVGSGFRATDNDIDFFMITDDIYSGMILNVGNYYNLTGAITYSFDHYRLAPRDESDVYLISDDIPPDIESLTTVDANTLIVGFTEPVDEVTSEDTGNYSVIASRDVIVNSAERSEFDYSLVTLSVSTLETGEYVLYVTNVEDFYGNAIDDASYPFTFTAFDDWSVIINEIDADTYSTDTKEFIELYDGGTGNTDLTGLALVLYNGADDASYFVFDLDGNSTDANGYLVLGNAAVPGVDIVFADNLLQNGTDAVALYQADAEDFPMDTPVTDVNLIDAIVYDTNDADDVVLINTLLNPGQPQVNEHGANYGQFKSNQRIPNGSGGRRNTISYSQHLPTPDAMNEEFSPIPQNVTIKRDGSNIVITWNSVQLASSYSVYSDSDPEGAFITLEYILFGDPPDTTWSETLPPDQKKYYQVRTEID